jgi:hypothetical protein
MNEKVRSIVIVVLCNFLFMGIGFAGGWFGHRASIANRLVDTDTRIMQERSDELKKRQSGIDGAFERGFGLLDQSAGAIRDSQDDAVRQLPRLERIGNGLDETIRELEAAKRSGNNAPANTE